MINSHELILKIKADMGNDFRLINLFLIDCLEIISDSIPIVGKEALCIAKKYWVEQSVSDEELERTRVLCWDYADSLGNSINLLDKEICAMRAVICVLYSKPMSEDLGDLLEFFLMTFEKIDRESSNPSYIIENLLSKKH